MVSALGLVSSLPALATGTPDSGGVPVGPAACTTGATPSSGYSVSTSATNGRLVTLRFTVPALGTPQGGSPTVGVNVLLPQGYASNTSTRYPVLYLLHGHGGSYADWADPTHHGDAAGIVGTRPMIVVMPDGGYDGFYSNWWGVDADGHNGTVAPAWETFHLTDVVGYIDHTYRTIADRSGRAIAGLSMGGFGAMSYAARHPDLFSWSGSFSGAVDTDLDWPLGPLAQQELSNLPDRKPADNCIWGDPVTNDVAWQAHDPTELAGNLANVHLFVASGTGAPDPDPKAPPYNPAAALTEHGIFQDTVSFLASLRLHGDAPPPGQIYLYGPGTHAWYYWNRDLTKFVGLLDAAGFTSHTSSAPTPASFSYESAEPAFSVWRWHFAASRAVREFTYLTDVNTITHATREVGGFGVHGTGKLSVTTPPLSVHSPCYEVTVTNTSTGASATQEVTPSPDGTISFTADLGPSHTLQQTAFGPAGEASTFAGDGYTVRIRLPPPKGGSARSGGGGLNPARTPP